MSLKRHLVSVLVFSLVITTIIPAPLWAGKWPFRNYLAGSGSVEQLAHRIDNLQKRIDEHGVVVARKPDIWGESRLLKHREEFEKEMLRELSQFRATLQAAESTRDVAFLSSALSLSKNLTGSPIVNVPEGAEAATEQQIVFVDAAGSLSTRDQISGSDNRIVPRSEGFGPKFQNNFGGRAGDGVEEIKSISLEPVIYLDQKKRYLDHLHALRRLNEGDDTADSPGYALNLLRIPVSVMPGRETRQGYGAEVQITVDPYASEELLPEVFRDFVVNGVVDRIAPSVMHIVGEMTEEEYEKLTLYWRLYQHLILAIPESTLSKAHECRALEYIERLEGKEDGDKDALKKLANIKCSLLDNCVPTPECEIKKTQDESEGKPQDKSENLSRRMAYEYGTEAIVTVAEALSNTRSQLYESIPTGLSTGLTQAFPLSHNKSVDGTSLIPIVLSTFEFLRPDERPMMHFEDVRRFLKQEVAGAYELLSQQSAQNVWITICNDRLVDAVKSHRRYGDDDDVERHFAKQRERLGVDNSLVQMRNEYYNTMNVLHPEADFSATIHLGWHIIVESAMLNDRLQRDIKEIATKKNCACVSEPGVDFFGPNPPLEARYAFNEYVRCRWPVKVFALDPVTDDQNVGSAFSQRRELQLALAIAYSNGIFGAENLNRFVRRLEYDLETIELNRTAIGFAFGDDTYGWRFYPRVQSPPVPGNVSAAFRDMLIGGRSREQLVTQRMLEPGIRECTALVVMPSFVPYMHVDIQTNWFKLGKTVLGHHLKRKMDLRDAVSLSKEWKELKGMAQTCLEDEHLVREGEVWRLQKALDQIERQLPLQTETIQIPYENQLSGFEAFNSGIAALGPQLIDWYGAPGVRIANGGDYPSGTTQDVDVVDTSTEKLSVTTKTRITTQPPSEYGPTKVFLIGRKFTSLGGGQRR